MLNNRILRAQELLKSIRQTTTGMTVKKMNGMTVFCSETHANFYPEEYSAIKEEAKNYKWVILYRDHYRGNAKGDYFAAEDFDRIFKDFDFCFYNIERPVYQVTLTNDDVPAIIEERRSIIREIQRKEIELSKIHIPWRPACDGRATERTQPKAFAEWREEKHQKSEAAKVVRQEIAELRDKLNGIQHYSTTLHRIN